MENSDDESDCTLDSEDSQDEIKMTNFTPLVYAQDTLTGIKHLIESLN